MDHNFTIPLCRFTAWSWLFRSCRITSYNVCYTKLLRYAGKIAGGIWKPGQKVKVLPSGFETEVEAIDFGGDEIEMAFPPQSVTIRLKDEIDISRGDMLVDPACAPYAEQDIDMMVCWFNEKPLIERGKYIIKHTTNEVRAIIKEIKYKVNINSIENIYDDKKVSLNDIACISVKTTKPLFFDSYKKNRVTGSVIIIDEGTNETVGAGMIL